MLVGVCRGRDRLNEDGDFGGDGCRSAGIHGHVCHWFNIGIASDL